MFRESSRYAASFVVSASLMSGLFLSVPMPNFGQTKDANSTPTTDPAKSTAQPGLKKPLSPMEDPSQIGKRKVNGGSDKFFGWLGGSQE